MKNQGDNLMTFPLLTRNVRPIKRPTSKKEIIRISRRLQSQVATDRKTVWRNIITIAIQLAYNTETLNKNTLIKYEAYSADFSNLRKIGACNLKWQPIGKTGFVNITTTAIQLAYETETLKKNTIRNTFIKKIQNFWKKMKNLRTLF